MFRYGAPCTTEGTIVFRSGQPSIGAGANDIATRVLFTLL